MISVQHHEKQFQVVQHAETEDQSQKSGAAEDDSPPTESKTKSDSDSSAKVSGTNNQSDVSDDHETKDQSQKSGSAEDGSQPTTSNAATQTSGSTQDASQPASGNAVSTAADSQNQPQAPAASPAPTVTPSQPTAATSVSSVPQSDTRNVQVVADGPVASTSIPAASSRSSGARSTTPTSNPGQTTVPGNEIMPVAGGTSSSQAANILNQFGNVGAGAMWFGIDAVLLSANRNIGAILSAENALAVVHGVHESGAGDAANPLAASPSDGADLTSWHGSPSVSEFFAPFLRTEELLQTPSLGDMGNLEAGLRHFLDNLSEGVEQAIEMPAKSSFVTCATLAVFAVAAVDLARRQLRRLAVEDATTDRAPTPRSSGFRRRIPRTIP